MIRIAPLVKLYLLGCLRRQAHLATLFLGCALFMLPAYVNSFSLGPETMERVAKDFGLILIGYFVVGMGILLGATSVPGDLEARSVYPILARPISRGGFLLAHYLSALTLLAGSTVFLSLCLTSALGLMIRHVDTSILVALYGSLLQAAIVAAVCLMLSVRTAPAVADSLGALLYLVTHLSQDFFGLFLGRSKMAAMLAKAVVPDLSLFALKDTVLHGITLGPGYVVAISLYALGWVATALLLANKAFQEVDL